MVTFTAFNNYKEQLARSGIDWENDTIKVALMTTAYTPNIDTQENWSDVSSNESSGTNYTAGGNTVANITVTQDNVNDRAVVDGDDVVFTNISVSYQYAVMYKDTGTPSTSTLIGYADRGSSVTLSNENIEIRFSATGINTLN